MASGYLSVWGGVDGMLEVGRVRGLEWHCLRTDPPRHTLPLPLHRPPNSRGPILCVTFPLSCPHWQIHIQLSGAGQGTEVLLSPVGAADAGGLYTACCIATGKSLKLGVVFTHPLQQSRDSLSPQHLPVLLQALASSYRDSGNFYPSTSFCKSFACLLRLLL